VLKLLLKAHTATLRERIANVGSAINYMHCCLFFKRPPVDRTFAAEAAAHGLRRSMLAILKYSIAEEI